MKLSKLKIALFAYLVAASYFAAHEVDDRLRLHYNTKSQQEKLSVADIADMLEETPAGKVLP